MGTFGQRLGCRWWTPSSQKHHKANGIALEGVFAVSWHSWSSALHHCTWSPAFPSWIGLWGNFLKRSCRGLLPAVFSIRLRVTLWKFCNFNILIVHLLTTGSYYDTRSNERRNWRIDEQIIEISRKYLHRVSWNGGTRLPARLRWYSRHITWHPFGLHYLGAIHHSSLQYGHCLRKDDEGLTITVSLIFIAPFHTGFFCSRQFVTKTTFLISPTIVQLNVLTTMWSCISSSPSTKCGLDQEENLNAHILKREENHFYLLLLTNRHAK